MPQIGHSWDNAYKALYYGFLCQIEIQNFIWAGIIINKIKCNLNLWDMTKSYLITWDI